MGCTNIGKGGVGGLADKIKKFADKYNVRALRDKPDLEVYNLVRSNKIKKAEGTYDVVNSKGKKVTVKGTVYDTPYGKVGIKTGSVGATATYLGGEGKMRGLEGIAISTAPMWSSITATGGNYHIADSMNRMYAEENALEGAMRIMKGVKKSKRK